MKIKDWTVAGQMTACVINIWNRCKDAAKILSIDPEIMAWLSEDPEGGKALEAAVKQVAEAYGRRIIPSTALKLVLGEIPHKNPAERLEMTWREFIEWGKTLEDGWRLPTREDFDNLYQVISRTEHELWNCRFWLATSPADADPELATCLHVTSPGDTHFQHNCWLQDKTDKLPVFCVHDKEVPRS